MILLLIIFLLKVAQCICPKIAGCVSSHNNTQVTCIEGGLLAIPTDLMNPTLRVLKISAPKDKKNNLTITAGLLTKFNILEEIHILMSNISVIERNSFYNSRNLKILNLSYNSLSDILRYHFHGLYNLVELQLDHNRIRFIDKEALQRLPNLRKLSLVDNRIKELTPRLFRGLGKLCQLDLSDNAVEELNPDVFRDLQVRYNKCFKVLFMYGQVKLYIFRVKLREFAEVNEIRM